MLVTLHYSHPFDQDCTEWCYDTLPPRRHATRIHGHVEGESCDLAYCYYQPTLLGQLKRALRR